MLSKSIAVAVLLASASPVLAQTQLERSFGVAPGTFSTVQLVEMERANAENDLTSLRHVMRTAGHDVVATSDRTSSAAAGQSVAERFLIATALEENDFDRAEFIAAGGLRSVFAGAEATKARLASDLNVNPADYTLARLVALKEERDN